MTDYTELKARAEAMIGFDDIPLAPDVILALIVENERLNTECKQLILLECHGGTAQAAVNLLAERDQLKAENQALRSEREGKVLCDLELFETLRDSAKTEADEHRQCMATYRPLRQANLDSVVKKCDDLLAAMGKEGSL